MIVARTTVVPRDLARRFRDLWDRRPVILLSAPCGCGKTTTGTALLDGRSVVTLEHDGILRGIRSIPEGTEAVLVDDLESLDDEASLEALCSLIRDRHDLHVVLLGRCPVPGWLMPFQVTGMLGVLDTLDLLFDEASSRALLELRGVSPSSQEMHQLQEDYKGFPLALEMLSQRLSRGGSYNREMYSEVKHDIFAYFDEAVFLRFEPPLRRLLLGLAHFESFDLEFVRTVSGDARAAEAIARLQRESSMMLMSNLETCHFWPIFREFLLWETHRNLDADDFAELYRRAALYYELHDQVELALECYQRAGDTRHVSEMLERNSVVHPGAGHYVEMASYYFALPREVVLRSPKLISGMSMVCAMTLDYDASEEWYHELELYAARLGRHDAELKDVRGLIAYLDVALPQRGSGHLVTVLRGVASLMAEGKAEVPEFSVTSTLPSIMNGGKDFSSWSRRDDLLYATMRSPVEYVLGRDGVGLADCAICESKFEKGEDISARLLTLVSRIGEIQATGTPDMEFAVSGLLARVQVSRGKAASALDSLLSLRKRYETIGEARFLPNIDAMVCRIRLRLGESEQVERWLADEAPSDGGRVWAFWRYRYITKAQVLISLDRCDEALVALAPLIPYCDRCGRVLDRISIDLLVAIAHERMGRDSWREELTRALEACSSYRFVMPVAQLGVAILPLLGEVGWEGDQEFLVTLVSATRAQAVYYPHYLECVPALANPLSATEQQVLRLICENLSNKRIGELLDVKLPTVKTHVSHILQKLGVSSRAEAKEAAERLHLV